MTRDDITSWLVEWISSELEMPAAEIDTSQSLLDYSMSSVTATILVGDLEDQYDLRLPPTLVWDYPSIDAMTEFLAGAVQDQAKSGAAAATPDAEALLGSLDDMSDEEVDALLAQLSEDDAGAA